MMSPYETERLKERAKIPVIMAVLFVMTWYFVSDWLEVSLESAMQEYHTNLGAASNSLRQQANDVTARELLEKLRGQLAVIDRWLPTESILPQLIDQIQNLGKTKEVQIRQMSYTYGPWAGRKMETDEYTPSGILIGFQLQAEYAPMRSFLQAIECLPSPLVPVEVLANKSGTYSIQVLQLVKP